LDTASPPLARISAATSSAGVGPAQVVHHHPCPFGGEQQRMLATYAAPGTGDDRDAAIE
jgi:hypothetical protein